MKINLGAGPVNRGIVLVQPVHSQNNIVIPNICNVKLYELLVVELAILAIDADMLDGVVDKNLAKGYICPSKSPMTSPFFFVKKKDKKLCLV